MRTFIYLMVFLLLAGGAYAAETSGEQKTFTATVGSDGVQRVEVTGGEYYFDPRHIIVKKDIPVELVVKRVSGIIPVPHNIIINAPEAGITIREDMPAEPKTIRFTPTKTGKYPMSCDKKLLFFPSHKDRGMEGVLEVVE